jgi:hypothetical protein
VIVELDAGLCGVAAHADGGAAGDRDPPRHQDEEEQDDDPRFGVYNWLGFRLEGCSRRSRLTAPSPQGRRRRSSRDRGRSREVLLLLAAQRRQCGR